MAYSKLLSLITCSKSSDESLLNAGWNTAVLNSSLIVLTIAAVLLVHIEVNWTDGGHS